MNRLLRGERVLVTGAEGFIGAALVRRLVCAGAEVHASVFDAATLWRLAPVRRAVRRHRLDVTDAAAVHRLIRRVRPRRVWHLAAAVDTRRDAALLAWMTAVNVRGTAHVLEALRRTPAQAVVLAGTAEEYGDGPSPSRETQREVPVSPYSWSKVAATHLAQTYHRLWGVPSVVVRFAVTYGPGQDNDLFVPSLIRDSLTGRVLAMTPGAQWREFNFVDDIAAGLMTAGCCPAAAGRVVNLAAGRAYRLRDVARRIVALTGADVEPRVGALPYRAHEAMRQACDGEAGRRLLGWRPRTGLDEGLSLTIAWFRQRLSRRERRPRGRRQPAMASR